MKLWLRYDKYETGQMADTDFGDDEARELANAN